MYECLTPRLRCWVVEQANKMGLPNPDSYITLLIRLEKQRQDLSGVTGPVTKHSALLGKVHRFWEVC